MQKLAFVIAFAAFGLLTQGASATTISTTQGSVTKECGNSSGCSKACGSTSCDYSCKKKSCTVTINIVRPEGGTTSTGSSTTTSKP